MAGHRMHSLAFKKQGVQECAAKATLIGLASEYDLSRKSRPQGVRLEAFPARRRRPYSRGRTGGSVQCRPQGRRRRLRAPFHACRRV